MDNFAPGGSGTILRLNADEAAALRHLVADMKAVVTHDDRSDPALERLYPDAYDDPDDQRSYRELIGGELQREKVLALDVMASSLAGDGSVEVELDADQAQRWLTGVTDIRLTLGTRLGVSEDLTGDDVDPDDPEALSWTLLHWLGWLQEQLLAAIDPDYRRMYG